EQIVKNVGEGRGEIGAEARPAAGALLEGRMAEAVIRRPLVRVLQDLVGLVDFLEAVLGVAVAGIAVRMQLHGKLAEGRFQLCVARAPRHPQDLVVVALGHLTRSSGLQEFSPGPFALQESPLSWWRGVLASGRFLVL